MTEYWKSYAKKFCEICKCWFADNRVSAERHEQGLRHKAMVQQRLRESSKKAKDREVEDHELKMTLYAMEQAARASLASDEQREVPTVAGPGLNYSRRAAEPDEPDPRTAELKEQRRKLKELKRKSKKSQCWVDDEEGGKELAEWVQAETADGQLYFWHIFSGETRWDKPDQFYTAAEYADRYEDIAAEAATNAHFSASTASAISSTSSSVEQHSFIDPQFVPQLTSAQVDNQIALSAVKEEPEEPPMKSYYGRREENRRSEGERKSNPNRRAELKGSKPTKWEAKEEDEPRQLNREERRKIKRERKAMAESAESCRVPEGLVELKTETAMEQQHEHDLPQHQKLSAGGGAHPLGPWVRVKVEEPKPDIAGLDEEMQRSCSEKVGKKRYDDLPEQAYGPGSSVYGQTPAELLEVAEIDPTDLEFGTKQQQSQSSAPKKSKVVGFRKPGTGSSSKQFRAKKS